MTPLAVAQALIKLSKTSEHKAAFLQVRQDLVIEVARASTQRWKEGKQFGLFDGVPVAVKGKHTILYTGFHFLDGLPNPVSVSSLVWVFPFL